MYEALYPVVGRTNSLADIKNKCDPAVRKRIPMLAKTSPEFVRGFLGSSMKPDIMWGDCLCDVVSHKGYVK